MVYVVKAGDTLSAIAVKYNTTVAALVAANGIKDKNLIHVGQKITIPTTKPATPAKKDYVKIGQAVETCVAAIEKLPEFKALEALLNG